jgi:hypothetical protein
MARLLAVLAVLVSAVIFVVNASKWPFTSSSPIFQLLYAASVGIGALGYLILSRASEIDIGINSLTDRILRQIQAVVFFCSAGFVLLVLDGVYYVKPPTYYAIIAVWGGSLLWVTAFSQRLDRVSSWWLLGQTILLGLVTVGSGPAINPFLTGPDAYWHINRITDVVNAGQLTQSSGHYYYYFILHTISAVTIQLSSVASVSFTSLTVLWGILIIPAVYLVVRAATNRRKLGLLSGQLLAINTLYIFGVANKSATYLGFLFVFLAIHTIFTSNRLSTRQAWMCLVIFAVAVFFTHFVTAILLATFLTVHLVVSLKMTQSDVQSDSVWATERRPDRQGRGVIVPFSWFIIAVVFYHVFVNTYVAGRILSIIFVEGDSGAAMGTVQDALSTAGALQYGFGFLGIMLIILLSSLGGFRLLSSLANRRVQLILWFGVMNSLAIIYLVVAGSSGGTLRILLSSVVIGSVPAAVGLHTITASAFFDTKIQSVMVLALVVTLAFAGPVSYLTWEDNTVYNDDIDAPQNHVRTSLVATHDFFSAVPNGSLVLIDSRTGIYLTNEQRGLRNKPDGITTRIFRYSDTPVTESHYTIIRESNAPSDSDLVEGKSRSTIYSNGEVKYTRS